MGFGDTPLFFFNFLKVFNILKVYNLTLVVGSQCELNMFNSKISSGSDKQRLSEEDIKETIHNFYRALITGNLEDVLSICTEDVVLNWASFIFKGKDGIRRWAGGNKRSG